MEKGKKMMQSFPGFVKDTSDIEEHALQSPLVLPAQNTRCSKSETLCLSKEQSHCSEDGWVLEWEICVFESVNYLDSCPKFNCAMKKSTEVFQSERQRKSQVSPGDVENDKDKDTEEPDQPSPSLLREKWLEVETYDGGDCPDKNPASYSARHLGCWAWLQRAFRQKK